MRQHTLKISKEDYEAKLQGLKLFGIHRATDGPFNQGDVVSYIVEPGDGAIQPEVFGITYITDYMQQQGYVVFGEKRIA